MKKIMTTIVTIVLILVGVIFTIRTALFPIENKSDIKRIANEYKIDPYLLAELAHFESRFDNKKYESNSNNGILRFSDEASMKLAKELKMSKFKPKDLVDSQTSLKLGAYYVSKFNNQGLETVIREWNVKNGDEDTIDRRAYASQYYLPKIERNMKIFKLLYPELQF
ncbi:MAG: transglycosylase SLT domain-containing protein [Paraclostridium sp.]|uniref:transglycosylase SLT domain-containing protein n=1 Tax=Paraclostridium sp. TaxID=2023273 RepID=UPI003F36312C